jgi:outer membrane protein TolC
MRQALDSNRAVRAVARAAALCVALASPLSWGADASQAAQETLSLPQFAQLLLANNRRAVAARAQAAVAQTHVDKAQAQYQPKLRLDLNVGEENELNSPEDAATRGEEGGNYRRRYDDLSAEVSTLLPTGGTVTGRSSLSRFWSSSFELLGDPDTALNRRYRAVYDVNFTQPLLKDRGSQVTDTPVRLAEFDRQMAEWASRDTAVLALGEGVNVYYDLVMAHHRREAAQAKVQMASELAQAAQSLLDSGRLDASAMADVEISRVQFEASLLQARETQHDLSNQAVKVLQAQRVGPDGLVPVDLTLPESPTALAPLEALVDAAWSQRADLKASVLAVDRQALEYQFHENQLKPRLDAKLNYGYSGLALKAKSAFGSAHRADGPTWSVGVVFETTLGSDRAMQANLAAAKIRQQQAADEREALRLDIRQDVSSAAAMVHGAAARWELWRSALKREQDNLALERQRFESGRSDVRALLLAQERVINVELQVTEQRVAYARALALLSVTQGQQL